MSYPQDNRTRPLAETYDDPYAYGHNSIARGQHTAGPLPEPESVFPFSVGRFTVGMLATTAIAALLAFGLTYANNWLAIEHGIPWSSTVQSISTNVWASVFLAIICATTFLLLVWQTDRPHLLFVTLAGIVTVMALCVPWATDVSAMAGFINGVAHAVVVLTVAGLTESLGRAALIRAQDPTATTY